MAQLDSKGAPEIEATAPANGHGLLEPGELAELGPPEAVRLPLDLVDPSPRNPRGQLPEIPELAANIAQFTTPRQVGLMQPITVRRSADRYEVIGGHRRLAAFQLLHQDQPLDPQWATIPAVIRTVDDPTAYRMLISAQVHSRAWRPKEEAYALEQLLLSGLNVRQVGESLNRTESWASRRLRVYSDSVLSGYVQSGALSTSVAEVFLAIKDLELRREIVQRAVEEGWSQPQAKVELRKLSQSRRVAEIGRLAKELLEALGLVQPNQIPKETGMMLLHLRRRITLLGKEPVLPTIEQAEKKAGVRTQERPRRGRRKPGYKPRTG